MNDKAIKCTRCNTENPKCGFYPLSSVCFDCVIAENGNTIRFRMRRGKIVKIPKEWVGKTVHDQTLRKRVQSRLAKRLRHKRHRKLLKIC